jgi:predicted amidohydrolase
MNLSLKRAAIAQLCSTASKHNNLLNVAKCARIASECGASVLFLPECFGFIGSSPQETLDNAEEINDVVSYKKVDHLNKTTRDDNVNKAWLKDIENVVENGDSTMDMLDNSQLSILEGLRAIAVKSGLWISAGGLHEKDAPPSPSDELRRPRVYNTHFIMDSSGRIVAKYRKIHLFDVSIPSQGVELRESATTAPGSKLVVCDSPIGKLGLSTCYDLRFPEMYTALVQQGGADVLLVPSAFTVPTGKAHWHTLLRGENISC